MIGATGDDSSGKRPPRAEISVGWISLFKMFYEVDSNERFSKKISNEAATSLKFGLIYFIMSIRNLLVILLRDNTLDEGSSLCLKKILHVYM
ncbi:hypothetical protein SAMN05518871_10898 [Psychrobacillus sp. OK028]|nr:hypothetical protein SAMN05518871_10898 [Psychrobacillus sp. OK028]